MRYYDIQNEHYNVNFSYFHEIATKVLHNNIYSQISFFILFYYLYKKRVYKYWE